MTYELNRLKPTLTEQNYGKKSTHFDHHRQEPAEF